MPRHILRFVPSRHLCGLLPAALLLQYTFWLRESGGIFAIRRSDQPQTGADELAIQLTPLGGAVVRRVLLGSDGKQLSNSSRRLICSLYTPGGSILAQLVSLLKRIEDLAHVLLWGALEPDAPPQPASDEPASAQEAGGDQSSAGSSHTSPPKPHLTPPLPTPPPPSPPHPNPPGPKPTPLHSTPPHPLHPTPPPLHPTRQAHHVLARHILRMTSFLSS